MAVARFTRSPRGPVVLLALAVLTSGCGGVKAVRDSRVFLTEADERTVSAHPHPSRETGVFCAEPSPDVAKAVAQSFNLSTAFEGVARGAQLPADVALQAAASISKSRAEALAQLTNRLATIQLLRDGLYRACEAYANGALTRTAYAVILSRYDDLMVTLLTGELVAGNFGQPLAALGTAAGGAAGAATKKAQEDAEQVRQRQKAVDDARVKEANAVAARKESDAALRACEAAPPAAGCGDKKKAFEDKDRSYEAARGELFGAMVQAMGPLAASAQSTAQVTFLQGVGAVARSQTVTGDDGVNRTLHEIQRKFVENINADALTVACIVELTRPAAEKSSLASVCLTEIPKVVQDGGQLLRVKILRGEENVVPRCVAAMRMALDLAPGTASDLVAKILSTCAEVGDRERQLRARQLELKLGPPQTGAPAPR